MEKFPTNNSDNMSDHIDNVSEVVDEVVDDSQESSENDEVGLDDVDTTNSAVESDATQNPDDTGAINVEQVDDTHNDTKDNILPEYRAALEQQEQNSKRVKIVLIGAAAIAGIAIALSLGGNQTTTSPQEPEVEDAVDDTDTNYTDTDEEDIASAGDNSTTDGPYDDQFLNEFMELYVNDRIDEGNSIILDSPGEEEVEECDDSLTVDKILDALEYNSLSNAINDDPERVAGYIKRWMIDNGYTSSFGDNIKYDNNATTISTYTDYYANSDVYGIISLRNTPQQDLLEIYISNDANPGESYSYQSNEIPNYDTLLQIAQENLG